MSLSNIDTIYNEQEQKMQEIYVGAGMLIGSTEQMSALFPPECKERCKDYTAAQDTLIQETKAAKKYFPITWFLSGGRRVKHLRTITHDAVSNDYLEWVALPAFIHSLATQTYISAGNRARYRQLVQAYDTVSLAYDALRNAYDTTQPDIRLAAKQFAENHYEAKA